MNLGMLEEEQQFCINYWVNDIVREGEDGVTRYYDSITGVEVPRELRFQPRKYQRTLQPIYMVAGRWELIWD